MGILVKIGENLFKTHAVPVQKTSSPIDSILTYLEGSTIKCDSIQYKVCTHIGEKMKKMTNISDLGNISPKVLG